MGGREHWQEVEHVREIQQSQTLDRIGYAGEHLMNRKTSAPRMPLETVRNVMCLGALAFLIFASYEVARSPLKALLTVRYGADALPYAWLGVAVAVTVTVMFYGRAAACTSIRHLYGRVVVLSSMILAGCLSLHAASVPGVEFLLFIWKDVYIVLLGEMFWTMANRLFELKRAKYVFGLFCALGSLGAFAGSWAIKTYAQSIGAAQLPWLVIPILVVSIPVVFGLPRMGVKAAPEKPALTDGLKRVLGHRYLLHILGMIACVQLAVNLMDYQLTHMIQLEHPGQDQQAATFGHIYGNISQLALVLQLSCGLILGLYGISGTLKRVPLILFGVLAAFAFLPSLALISAAFVLAKSLDYSLFRAAKEALYLPLEDQERTQGKAVIDMMIYRVAKGGASLLLITLAASGVSMGSVALLCLAAVFLWIILTWRLIPLYLKRRSAHLKQDVDSLTDLTLH